jgi:hypothetical protein
METLASICPHQERCRSEIVFTVSVAARASFQVAVHEQTHSCLLPVWARRHRLGVRTLGHARGVRQQDIESGRAVAKCWQKLETSVDAKL